RCRLVDRAPLLVGHRAGLIGGIADHIDDGAERAVADPHRDRLAGVHDPPAAPEAPARVPGGGAAPRRPEMLGDCKSQAMALILRLERVEDGRQMPFEVHVDDCADHLRDVPDWICHGWSLLLRRYRRLRVHTASAPEMISISSFVIIAWRVR